MSDAARILGEVLDEELAYWTPRRSGEITDNVIETLVSHGYAIMRVEPWAGAENAEDRRLAMHGYRCTCPSGCMEHPFGPPRPHDS
jgi:hypothetical protein